MRVVVTNAKNCFIAVPQQTAISAGSSFQPNQRGVKVFKLRIIRRALSKEQSITTNASGNNNNKKADPHQIIKIQQEHYRKQKQQQQQQEEKQRPSVLYVGWAGGIATSPGTVELSASFCQSAGLSEGDDVLLDGVSGGNEYTASINVEPESEDDWEILELNAGFVEMQLLQQIGVVSSKMLFPLWIGSQQQQFNLIHLRVLNTFPSGFAKLHIDSQVVVAPKTRRKEENNPQNNSAEDSSSSDQKEASACLKFRAQLLAHVPAFSSHLSRSVFVTSHAMRRLECTEGDLVLLTSAEPEKSKKFGAKGSDPASSAAAATTKATTSNAKSSSSLDSAVVRVFAWDDAVGDDQHIMLADLLRQEIAIKPFSHVFVQKIVSDSIALLSKRPITSITLREIVWKFPQRQDSIDEDDREADDGEFSSKKSLAGRPSDELSTLYAQTFVWLRSYTQSVPMTNGSLLCCSVDDSLKTFAVYFNDSADAKTEDSSKQQQQQQQQEQTASSSLDLSLAPTYFLLEKVSFRPDKSSLVKLKLASSEHRPVVEDVLLEELEKLNIRKANDIKRAGSNKQLPFDARIPFGFTSLAEMDEEIDRCKSHLRMTLSSEMMQLRKRVTNTPLPGGLLVVGPAGSGKSSLAIALSSYFRSHRSTLAHTLWIDGARFATDKTSSVRTRLKKVFENALQHSPTLIVLDNLDSLVPTSDEHDPVNSLQRQQIGETLADLMLASLAICQKTSRRITWIAIARAATQFHSSLHISGLFGRVVKIEPPSNRVAIFEKLLARRGCTFVNKGAEWFNNATEGYVGSDLKQLTERSIHVLASRSIAQQSKKQDYNIHGDDVKAALQGFVPASLKDLPLQSSTTKWSEIGGLFDVKRTLKETLELPNQFSRLFEQVPLKLRSGLLLYGPPGTGKTLLASAVANECKLNFISVKGPELLNKYIGASEQAVRDIFERAGAARPCVLFFDEFEAIAPKRGADSTGVTDRVVNQFLCHLDGVEGRSGVYVLAASSRPDLIDPALLRPGRLDKALYCDFPDEEQRFSILCAIVDSFNMRFNEEQKTKDPKLAVTIQVIELDVTANYLRNLAKRTTNYTGADLRAIFTNAHLNAVHEQLEKFKKTLAANTSQQQPPNTIAASSTSVNTNASDQKEEHFPTIGVRHIEEAFSTSSCSVSDTDRRKYQWIYKNFISGRQDADQVQAGKQKVALA